MYKRVRSQKCFPSAISPAYCTYRVFCEGKWKKLQLGVENSPVPSFRATFYPQNEVIRQKITGMPTSGCAKNLLRGSCASVENVDYYIVVFQTQVAIATSSEN